MPGAVLRGLNKAMNRENKASYPYGGGETHYQLVKKNEPVKEF